MHYIVIKRYKRDDARGRFNLPYGTIVEERDGILYYGDKDICGDHSAVMREYFARNDDGKGLERGKLTQAITSTLAIRPDETKEEHDERWDVVWQDELCQKYKKPHQENHWLWAIEFFNAPIEDLEYIARLVGAKGVD